MQMAHLAVARDARKRPEAVVVLRLGLWLVAQAEASGGRLGRVRRLAAAAPAGLRRRHDGHGRDDGDAGDREDRPPRAAGSAAPVEDDEPAREGSGEEDCDQDGGAAFGHGLNRRMAPGAGIRWSGGRGVGLRRLWTIFPKRVRRHRACIVPSP